MERIKIKCPICGQKTNLNEKRFYKHRCSNGRTVQAIDCIRCCERLDLDNKEKTVT